MSNHEYFMTEALIEAKKAEAMDEVPIGCVIVYDDQIIARGHNLKEIHQLSINHAEIVAIVAANQYLNSWRLEDCTLYVTLEPCTMCAGAIYQSRIKEVVFGASDPKGGAYGSIFNLNEQPGINHYPNIIKNVLANECSEILTNYFKSKRRKSVTKG